MKVLQFLRQMLRLLVLSSPLDLVQMQILSSLLLPQALVLKIPLVISLLHRTLHLSSKIFLQTQPPFLQRYQLRIHPRFFNNQFLLVSPLRHLSLQLLAHRLLLMLLPQHLLLLKHLRLLTRLLIHKHLILLLPASLKFPRLWPHHLLLLRVLNL
jgi:hypothetical protein